MLCEYTAVAYVVPDIRHCCIIVHRHLCCNEKYKIFAPFLLYDVIDYYPILPIR